MKIYTRTGDDGTSGLLGGSRAPKSDRRFETVGALDELNAWLGLCQNYLESPSLQSAQSWLQDIQSDLFILGAHAATPFGSSYVPPPFPTGRVQTMEDWIDAMEKDLPTLTNFILPKGTVAAGHLHVARALCRRAERSWYRIHQDTPFKGDLVSYLNRLADFLFVLARWVNRKEGGAETVWAGPDQRPDRMAQSLHKLAQDKEKRKDLFEKASQELQKKKDLAQKNFLQNVDQIKKDGGKVDPLIKPIDLD